MSDGNTQQPQRLTHEQIVGRLKSTSIFPMQSEMVPPMGLRREPTWVPGHPGIQAYFWTIGMSLSSATTERMPEKIAEHAIAVADAVFDKLAMKFELMAELKDTQ